MLQNFCEMQFLKEFHVSKLNLLQIGLTEIAGQT